MTPNDARFSPQCRAHPGGAMAQVNGRAPVAPAPVQPLVRRLAAAAIGQRMVKESHDCLRHTGVVHIDKTVVAGDLDFRDRHPIVNFGERSFA